MKSFLEFKHVISETDNFIPDNNAWESVKKLINMRFEELKDIHEENDLSVDYIMVKILNTKTYDEAAKEWTSDTWEFVTKLVSKINKIINMRGRLVGNPFERNGNRTNWYNKLLLLGHDAKKY